MNVRTILALGALIVGMGQADEILYVNVQAKSGGDGSREKPVSSLEEVRDLLRSRRKAGTLPKHTPIQVRIAPGKYPVLKTIEFTTGDSGTAEAPIRFRAEKKGEVLFYGGHRLTEKDFSKCTDPAILGKLSEAVRD